MKAKIDTGKLDAFEQRLGYRFSDRSLLVNALSHTSYTNEQNLPKTSSNERLEFLGDAIADLVVSDYLYRSFPDLPEGALTKIRAAVVCEGSFAHIAGSLGYGECILLGKGERATGGRERASVLADAFEAVVAAMYLDGGMERVSAWIIGHLEDSIQLAASGRAAKDYKTELQELVQKGERGKVTYSVIGEEGPDHAKTFTVQVSVDGKVMAQGKGTSKKDAEQVAAGAAISLLSKRRKRS